MLNSKEFVRELQLRHESAWMNPNVGSADAALAALPLTRTDVDDAEARLERFAPFIKKVFPETAADRGLIESPLTEIEHMRAWLNENEGAQLAGKLFLKRDSDLPVAGSDVCNEQLSKSTRCDLGKPGFSDQDGAEGDALGTRRGELVDAREGADAAADVDR